MKKQFISIVLSLTMILLMLPQFSLPVYAATAPDTSIGLDFTNGATDWTGTGAYAGVSWVSGTKTLTLTNANIHGNDSTTSSAIFGIEVPGGTTVILNGNNTVTGGVSSYSNGSSYGLRSSGALTIQGTGSLVATGGSESNSSGYSEGISSTGTLTISSGTVTATGGSADMAINGYSFGIDADTLTLSGGIVTATAGSALTSLGMTVNTVNLSGGLLIARGGVAGNESKGFRNPTGGSSTVNATGVSLLTGDPYHSTYAVYGNSSTYKVNTTGLDFSADPVDAGNLATNGYQWVQSTETLTLSNLIINTTALTAIKLPAGAILDVQGTNVIRSGDSATDYAKSYGINDAGSLTIQDSGTITVIGGNLTGLITSSYGISAVNSINISNAAVNAFGGTASGYSYGIYGTGGASSINISSGNVVAIGGTATATSNAGGLSGSFSCGIMQPSNKDIFSGGNITAMGGTVNFDDSNTSSAGIFTVYPSTITGGNIAAIAGVTPNSTNANSSGIYLNHGDSSPISGGNITAIGNVVAFKSAGLILTNNEGVTLASANIDGSSPVTYVDANLGTYKYVRVGLLTYTATINLKKDGSAWTGSGKAITLQQASETPTPTTENSGVFTANVGNGTWKILEGGVDTGETVVINNAAASQDLNYYTVQFAVTDAGTASGSTISATYNSSPITSGDVVLGGQQLVITAAGAGASSYSFGYTGIGTNNEANGTFTSSSLWATYTVSSLVESVNAIWTVTGTTATYTATINLKKDGSAWTGSGKTITLQQASETPTPTTETSGVFTANVGNGTWKILVGGVDTGETVVINNAAASQDLNYYTVQFAVTDAGTASGSTISATYNSSPITSGAVVLGGQQLVVTAAGQDASSYAYAWSGAGTSNQTTAALTISNLNATVDASCNVTGTGTSPSTPALNTLTLSGTIPDLTVSQSVYDLNNLSLSGTDQYGDPFSLSGQTIQWNLASGNSYASLSGSTLTPAAAGSGTVTATVYGKTSNALGFTVIPSNNSGGGGGHGGGGNGGNGGGGSNGGSSSSSPSSPSASPNTVTGNVIDGATGTDVAHITGTVTAGGGNDTVSMTTAQLALLGQPDGTTSPLGDLAQVSIADSTGNPVPVSADGTVQVADLFSGTDHNYNIFYDLGNGQKITISTLEINIDSSGTATLTETLIDPYGIITDAATGKALAGVNVTLYYADTARNKAAGKTPDTVVALPGIPGFNPNNNQDPQISDVSGAYGFMVFPDTDYYIVASKDGYNQYTSPTISVGQDELHWDFSMTPTTSGVTRLAGENRVDTALAIAQAEYPGQIENVVLATADNYPDALSGSTLAYKENAPILLVGSTASDQEKVLAYLKSSLDPAGTVYILGGDGAVSGTVENDIAGEGFTHITRLGGTDRYGTSAQIAEQLGVTTGTPVVLVSGENYPDALSVSSVAAQMQYPILLVQQNGLSSSVSQEIAAIKPGKIYIIGGEGVISPAVESQVAQLTGLAQSGIVRIGGADRYATSLDVAQYFNLSGQDVCVATGSNFPDALAGSVYAAKHDASIILADGSLPDQTVSYLKSKNLSGAILFGGEAVVSQGIAQQLGQLVGSK